MSTIAPALSPVFSLEAARAAEAELLSREVEPDALMKKAAHACAEVAAALLPTPGLTEPARVLVVAGPGGNGGDGLFAGAHLALLGHTVHAVLTADTAHETAHTTFLAAGGQVVPDKDASAQNASTQDASTNGIYDLVIDAVAGLGSSREATEEVIALMARGQKILSIDAPTGCGTQRSVIADATITFGHARTVHAEHPECGEVLIADIGLAEVIEKHAPVGYTSAEPSCDSNLWESPLPEGIARLADTGPIPRLIPGIFDNKYTHGVTGIAAGSEQFPGAGIMCTAGALHTTTSMVLTIGDITNFPEVVPVKDVAAARRVDAWVVGPGRGTDDAALSELEEILDSKLPVVIDADAITLIAQHPHLRERVRGAVLTPHAGEFARLGGKSQQQLSDELGCHILLKGRITTITSPHELPVSVNTGNSFAATAGSGDVLAGVIGALLAWHSVHRPTQDSMQHSMQETLLSAVAIHAHAAALSAKQPEGYAPTTAMAIATALSRAIAKLNTR
ncbi:bifunctional ADP-dependent NAD(P)H-hydrate dehydratase/NAD(P)H-hydrate epimerase [Corynebacterium sp. J010B-136]|uniref:bifunctional ADP-dependent NAD(P)H-hydrate dehydratase/NAD(P)H-hydrate epimerase n=1 Tax=Corynebacterium sp. J010B-136 TaxID=2099401 RepID=UPI001E54878B|nr:bifunctional ADP-dependent NAD(P)H-hydrate dehydratase/NAD(P)H-hydrate epimerase [Corynebacterium sp. J010B-136]